MMAEETKINKPNDAPRIETPGGTLELKFNQEEAWRIIQDRNDNIEKQIKKIENKIDKFDDKIKDSNIKTIETLGIFVALFTFVSMEFQIFRSFTSWYAGASLSLIILGSLSFFLLLITALLNKKVSKYFIILFILPLIFIGTALFLWKSSPVIDTDYILKTEINKDFYSKEELNDIIKENAKNKQILDCLKDKEYFSIKCFQ